MGVEENSQDMTPTPEQIQERTSWIEDREIAHTALEDYLKSRDKEIPDSSNYDIVDHVAKILDEEEYRDLRQQFRFGGRKSMNFFVITGISDKIEELRSAVVSEFPTAEEVEGQPEEPYYVDDRYYNDHLYVICGKYVSQRTTDPDTGSPQRRLYPDECVAVLSENTDLVHVRTANVALARNICSTIAHSVGLDRESEDIFYKPSFNQSFIDELSDRIEKYVNMTVSVSTGTDRAAGSIQFTSTKDESGEYMDLRDDEKVQDELEAGTIQRGYVVLSESDFSFELNRPQSKLWFRSYEREERLTAMAGLIDDVLKQSGGYPQRKLQGFENVPE